MKMVFTEVMGDEEKVRDAFPDDDVAIFDGPLDEDELIHEAGDADVLSVFIRTRIDDEVIGSLTRIRMINTRSAGFDHIDVQRALENGIAVTHVPDYGSHVVAEHAFCLLLACARDLVPADRSVRVMKRFDFQPFQGVELKGKVLGVLGTGRIGGEVIRIAQGFGMRVLAFDMYENEPLASEYDFPYLPLAEVLEKSDFVTIHLPLTADTENLIDRTSLKRMKAGSILINTARGRIVDEAALREALDAGHIRAAGLDVISDEDHPDGDPLLEAENAILTPHIAFFTRDSVSRMLDRSIETIRSFRGGRTINEVPREYVQMIEAPDSRGR